MKEKLVKFIIQKQAELLTKPPGYDIEDQSYDSGYDEGKWEGQRKLIKDLLVIFNDDLKEVTR